MFFPRVLPGVGTEVARNLLSLSLVPSFCSLAPSLDRCLSVRALLITGAGWTAVDLF